MKAGRKKDQRAGYVMHRHKNGEYYYAYTFKPEIDKKGVRVYKRTQWGRLDSSMRFLPAMNFRTLPEEEKKKFVFPKEWDLSRLEYKDNVRIKEALKDTDEQQSDSQRNNAPSNTGIPVSTVQAITPSKANEMTTNDLEKSVSPDDRSVAQACGAKEYKDVYTLMIGGTWLILEWAERIGLNKDLLEAFGNNQEKVDLLMTLVIYALLNNYTFYRVNNAQATIKFPTNIQLTPGEVTKFFSRITLKEMSRFFELWGERFDGETCGFDSTSISSYSQLFHDAKWGYNKDGDDLPQINFVVIYSLTSGVPIYYQEFSGNYPDCRGLLSALKIIHILGFKDIVLVTDRGYESLQNIETLAWEGQKLLTAAKTSTNEVREIIQECKVINSYPRDMEYNAEFDVFYKQVRKELELEKDGVTKKIDYRINVYFSIDKALDETKRLFKKVKEMKTAVQDAIVDRVRVDRKTFSKKYNLLKIEYTDDDYVLSYKEDTKKIDENISLHGFYASKTLGIDTTPMAAYIKYKFRDEHEKDFYIMKDSLHMSRLRSYTEQSKNGRVFTLFIALIIASSLSRELRYNQVLGPKYHNVADLLGEMMSVRATYKGTDLVSYESFIGMQRVIAESLNLEIPKGSDNKYLSIQKVRTGKRGRPRKPRVEVLNS